MIFAIYLNIALATYWFISKSQFGKKFQSELLEENCQSFEISTIKICFAIFWPLWWCIAMPIAEVIFIFKDLNDDDYFDEDF